MTLQRPIVGFHDFLNSKPLLHAFRHGMVETPFTLITDTPSNLAQRFHAGEIDIAMIPSIEYARSDDAVIIPSLCIASLGSVETVLLFSELAIEDVESVCVDPKSKTSVALLEMLFEKQYGKRPSMVVAHNDDPDTMLGVADAGLLIGDSAYGMDRKKYVVHDLGELWFQYSGMPFVHALLCAKKGKKWNSAIKAIEEAKKFGMEHRELISKQETTSHDDAQRLLDYLIKRIHYNLNESETDGLKKFLSLGKELSIVNNDELRFYESD